MSMVRKTITVTSHQDEWIKAQIASGNYGNDSEVVRDLIRREQNRAAEIETIRAALIEGEESGISPRTPQQIVGAARERLKQDGKI